MKYEVTVAGAAVAPVLRVETSSLPKKLAQSQRTIICPTEQQSDRFASQSVSQWLVNTIGIEIVLNLLIVTTLIQRTLRRWRP